MAHQQSVGLLLATFLAIPALATAQGLEGFGDASSDGISPISNRGRIGYALIDDTDLRRDSARSPELTKLNRFQVVLFNDTAILVDSATGRTWVLTQDQSGEQPSFQWIPIPRRDEKTGDDTTTERPLEKPPQSTEQPLDDDPFSED